VDDYAVDEVERNDESLVFVVEAVDSRIRSVKLHPARIELCQVNLARGLFGRAIGERMRNLCADLKTSSKWSAEGFLQMELGPPNKKRGKARGHSQR